MTPYYQDDWLTVHLGDCRAVMAGMEPESVHCVVTSPPYWGLRDYGTASWEGGDEGCDHKPAKDIHAAAVAASGLGGGKSNQANAEASRSSFRDTCRKCGARRIDQQLGLEPTPEAYVEAMVAVFREVRRVLRSDGTVWLNLGDSYAGSWGNQGRKPERGTQRPINGGMLTPVHDGRYPSQESNTGAVPPGLKPKDLVGIPWRVAFALQADGWYLRSDIIWSKPNPMPESVTDRPTKAHEYLFLLTKSPRYFFDNEAVRLPISPYNEGVVSVAPHGSHVLAGGHRQQEQRRYEVIKGANIRTVWTVATQPYPGAHFATFPPKLIEPCILAGCPEGGTVLDPFAGSGTTAMVANRLSRRAVLIDLNADYLGQVMDRNRELPLGLVG